MDSPSNGPHMDLRTRILIAARPAVALQVTIFGE